MGMAARYLQAFLAYLAFFALFFSPALYGGNYMTTAGDGSNIALPAYLIPHGLWEPDIMLGYPWASNFNGGWSPMFLLHFIPHSFNVYMLAAYAVAALGAFACVDVLAHSTIGGVVAGLSYALGGFMIGHFGHYDIVQAAAWAPWVFCALFAQRRTQNVRSVALVGAAVAMCALGGQPQVLAYTVLFGTVYVATAAFGIPHRMRYVSLASASICLGLGLAAVALAPGLLLTLASFRAHVSLDYFLAFSEPVWQLPIRVLLPFVVGQSGQPLYPYSSVGLGSEAELAAYGGILPIILAVVAIICRRRDVNVIFLTIGALVALLLSSGDGFHISALTFHIPLLNLFRAQGRHVLEFTLFLSILGGLGAAEIARGNVKAKTLCGSIAFVGACMIGATIDALRAGVLSAGASRPLSNSAFVIPFVIFVSVSSVLLLFQRLPASRGVLAIVSLCAAADMASFAWFEYWRTPLNESALTAPPVAVALGAALRRSHQRAFSVAGAVGDGIPPNLSLIWGVPEAGGYVSLLLTSPGIFLQLFPQGTIAPELLANVTDRSFDLASIRYIVAPKTQSRSILAARPGWRFLKSSDVGDILENTAAEPRIRILHRVVSMSADNTLKAIRTGSIDTRTTAMIQGAETLDTVPDRADAATLMSLTSDAMLLNTTCREACFVETSDTYNSMWVAAVDGEKAPLHLTDYALRGVFVPAGRHSVAFHYRPWIIWFGATVSTASFLAAFVLLFVRETGLTGARGAASGS